MNNEEKILKLEEEIKELKNQLVMKSNKIKELEFTLEHKKSNEDPFALKAQSILENLLEHSPQEFKSTLEDLLNSFMCFDSAADCSKERNEKVYCVNTLKHFLCDVEAYNQAVEKD